MVAAAQRGRGSRNRSAFTRCGETVGRGRVDAGPAGADLVQATAAEARGPSCIRVLLCSALRRRPAFPAHPADQHRDLEPPPLRRGDRLEGVAVVGLDDRRLEHPAGCRGCAGRRPGHAAAGRVDQTPTHTDASSWRIQAGPLPAPAPPSCRPGTTDVGSLDDLGQVVVAARAVDNPQALRSPSERLDDASYEGRSDPRRGF